SRENAGAPVMRWVRTTLPWMSMTVTATGTFCLNDSASTRSATSFAVVSKSVVSRSMVVCFLSESEKGIRISAWGVEAQLAQVEPESILDVAGPLEPLFQEGFDVFLRGWSLDGAHAGIPARSHFDV